MKHLFLVVGAAIVASLWSNVLLDACQIESQGTGERARLADRNAEASSSREVEFVLEELPQAYAIDPDLTFERVVVGATGASVAAGTERLIYSNTLGTKTINFPSNQPVSDDIAITAPNGCNLKRFRFMVLGKAIPTGISGPYTVTYALYSNCPSAVGTTNAARDLVKIAGTDGVIAFPDDAPREIEHMIDPLNPVAIPTNFYLGIRFNRANCGTIVGAPALVGFSGDIWDSPNFPCNSNLGGFPTVPHASFWAEFFGDTACEEAHLGYKSARASGSVATIGANIQGVDDFKLIVNDCQMVGYEVVVKGVGFYSFDLRRACDGQIVAGTEKIFIVNAGTTPLLQVARFTFNPPIPIPEQLFLGFKCSTNSAGAVLAGTEPVVGESSVDYFIIGLEGCAPVTITQGVHGAINLAITCASAPPQGACCDSFLRDAQSEAVCRDVAEVNCPGQAPGPNVAIYVQRQWIAATTCSEDLFPHPCGIAACCKPDDTCENLTKNQCNMVEPLDRPRLWQQGEFCNENQQSCPFNACLAGEGDCLRVHPETGCSEPFCCQEVCEFDSWCCLVEWDEFCLRWADDFCPRAPGNDQCANGFPISGFAGAFEIPVPGILFGTNTHATLSTIEPGFCCHQGLGICQSGFYAGELCLSEDDCGSYPCLGVEPDPNMQGYGPVWYKFVATHSTARISACGSGDVDSRFTDSLLQVFAVGDPTTGLTACNTLSPIGCNDDAGQACPDEPANAELCVSGLALGQVYYVLLASKLPQFQGRHRIAVSSPCYPDPISDGDYCPNAVNVSTGVTPFDLSGATFDCPADACTPTAQNDLWYNYTATCTGEATITTCGGTSPNTNLLVYEDCTKCPPFSGNPIGCNGDFTQLGCGEASRVVVGVTQGQCYKVRLADEGGVAVSGNLTIACFSNDCQPNGFPDDQDIANCATDELHCRDCNVNGIPDECDIRDDYALDLNFNGRIDECETCPSGIVILLTPPNRVVDARRPHPLGNTNELEGIDAVQVAAFAGADPSCWSLCETNLNAALHPPYPQELGQNEIIAATEKQPGQYSLQLKRPITPGETTIIMYTNDLGEVNSFRFTAHPGNVDANSTTHPVDLLMLIDVLNEVASAPWGLYSTDCDQSGASTPVDILCVIDLLNSGWSASARPSNSAGCP